MNLEKEIQFLSEIEKLKTVKRQNKTLDGRYENSAEHSWHLALMPIVFSDLIPEDIDKNRVIEMLLIHDLVEIYADDSFLYNETDRQNAEIKEQNAAVRLFNLLPKDKEEYFTLLRKEFESELTKESKIAKAFDGFQPLLNHILTCEKNVNIHSLKKSQIIQKKLFIKEYLPSLWEYVLEIIDKSVEKGLYINE